MPLQHPPFAVSTQLTAVANGHRSLRTGSSGPAVALLQAGLLDLGYSLPHSKRKDGATDGIFGAETARAVAEFQRTQLLPIDSSVGTQTLRLLDAELVKKFKPPPVKGPPAAPPAPLAEYMLGTADPTISPDAGSGMWDSTPTQLTYVALRATIIQSLPAAWVVIGDDATKHMAHYLDNSGDPYTVDLEGMVNEVPSAKQRYEREVSQAKRYVETLKPGAYDITSARAENGYNRQAESKNWYFAIGGYSTWGKGKVTVTEKSGERAYRIEFEYKFYDRYNWDAGKSVTFANITVTDRFMGEFHRQGLAREFDCLGSMRRVFSWRQGEPIAQAQLDTPVGGRG